MPKHEYTDVEEMKKYAETIAVFFNELRQKGVPSHEASVITSGIFGSAQLAAGMPKPPKESDLPGNEWMKGYEDDSDDL